MIIIDNIIDRQWNVWNFDMQSVIYQTYLQI